MSNPIPKSRSEWIEALNTLPGTPSKIPAFFFGHGSPMLAFPKNDDPSSGSGLGPNGSLAHFLEDFGPALLEKYKPKGIAVFSAHWETSNERLGLSIDFSYIILLTRILSY